jgi:hypothetical protein
MRLIRGQGLAKLLAESNFRALGINGLQGCEEGMDMNEIDEKTSTIRIEEKFASSDWYKNIVAYLLTLKCPSDLSSFKSRMLKLHAVKHCIFESQFYWKDPLGFLLVCLVESEKEKVMKGATADFEMHLNVENLFRSKRQNLFFSLYPLSLIKFRRSKTNDSIHPIQERVLLFFPSRRKTGSLVGAYVGASFLNYFKCNS